MIKQKCINCKEIQKVLTKDNLCAYCHKKLKKVWPGEFKENNNKKKKS